MATAVALLAALSQPASAQQSPQGPAAASEVFYRTWIAERPFDAALSRRSAATKTLASLATERMSFLLSAWSSDDGYDPVSSYDAGAGDARVEGCEGGSMVAACDVWLTSQGAGARIEWRDRVYLLRSGGRWLVFDIAYGSDRGDRGRHRDMAELLASGLNLEQGPSPMSADDEDESAD